MNHVKPNTADMINSIADEINSVLDNHQKERYFESLMLLYSMIENLLKWIVYTDIVWKKYSKKNLRMTKNLRREWKEIHQFCKKKLNFFSAARMALASGRIDFKLYKRVDSIREERNDVIHQLWIYRHRHNRAIIRKKLEKLALVTSALVGVCRKMGNEIGVDEIWDSL